VLLLETPRRSQVRRITSLVCGLVLGLIAASAVHAADMDGDGFADEDDRCPFTFDDQSDTGGIGLGSGPDGIGDACQCGDADDDGVVTPADGELISDAALGLDPTVTLAGLPGFTKCDVGGTEGCSGLDGSIVTRAALGLAAGIVQACPAATRTAVNNLSLGDVPVTLLGLSEIQRGHTALLQVVIQADAPASNVAIQFFLVDKQAYDAAGETDDIPQFILGAAVLETVNAGQNLIEIEVEVPPLDLDQKFLQTGEYYLYPVLDPGQEMLETDESDNVPPEANFALVTVSEEFSNTPSIVVEDVLIDLASFELPQVLSGEPDPDTACPGGVDGPRSNFENPSDVVLNALNTNISVTAVFRASGPASVTSSFAMSLSHPRIGDSPLCPGGACPIPVWNSGLGDYALSASLPLFFYEQFAEQSPVSVHVDMRIPATPEFRALFNNLLNGIESDCELACGDPNDALCVSACSLAELAQGSLRVEVIPFGAPFFENPVIEISDTLPITILPPRFVGPEDVTETQPLRFEEGFDAGFSAGFAGAGLRANAWAALDQRGATAHADASVPITLFGQEFEFLGLDTDGGAFPGSLDLDFSLDLRFAGIVVYSQLLSDETCALDLNQRGDLSIDQLRAELLKWKLDFFIEKSKGTERDFVVGIVPLTAAFEASGKLGFLVEAAIPVCDPNYVDTLFQAHMGPYMDVGMLASAGVGTSKGFSAGIEGQATLIEDTFFTRGQVGQLTLLQAPVRVSGTLTTDITNTLEGPKGSINLFVGYPCFKFCRVFGVPIPCGVAQCKSRKSIFRFTTFTKQDVLLCREATTSVEVPGL